MSAIAVGRIIDSDARVKSGVRACCEVNGMKRDCRVFNITQSGLFVESFVPAITGSPVHINFTLPNNHQVATTGTVTYYQLREGFHVEFSGLSERDRTEIARHA